MASAELNGMRAGGSPGMVRWMKAKEASRAEQREQLVPMVNTPVSSAEPWAARQDVKDWDEWLTEGGQPGPTD